jgi:hypothetical protein
VVDVAPAGVSPVVGGATVVLDSLDVDEGSLEEQAAASKAMPMPTIVNRARTEGTTMTQLGLFLKG